MWFGRLTPLFTLVLAACAPHYEWVEAPDAPPPEASSTTKTRPELGGPRTAGDLACEGSTSATRQYARQNRYRSVEGFNTRGCVRPGPWKATD